MAAKILALKKEHADWSTGQIAKAVGSRSGNVSNVLLRHGLRKTSGRKRRRGDGHKLMDWERFAIVEAYKAGEKLSSIAAEFDCDDSTVSRIACAAGLPRRQSKLTAKERNEIENGYRSGLSVSSIARRYKVSPAYVCMLAKDRGCPPRRERHALTKAKCDDR